MSRKAFAALDRAVARVMLLPGDDNPYAVAAVRLGPVHRFVRLPKQVVLAAKRGLSLCHADADGGFQNQITVLELAGLHRLAKSLGRDKGLVQRRIRKENDEFLPPQR